MSTSLQNLVHACISSPYQAPSRHAMLELKYEAFLHQTLSLRLVGVNVLDNFVTCSNAKVQSCVPAIRVGLFMDC